MAKAISREHLELIPAFSSLSGRDGKPINLHLLPNSRCFSVWGLDGLSHREMGCVLTEHMPHFCYYVFGFRRVQQKINPCIRFDFAVDDRVFEVVLEEFRLSVGANWNIFTKPFASFAERRALQVASGLSVDSPPSDGFDIAPRFVSLNVNSLKSKLNDVRELLYTLKPHVVFLQETLRTSEDLLKQLWLGSHFVAYESPFVPDIFGARGLAILIAHQFRPISVIKLSQEDGGLLLGVEFCPQASVSWVFVNVYLCRDAVARERSLQALTRLVERRPQSVFVVGGDFNMHPHRLRSWLAGGGAIFDLLPLPQGSFTTSRGTEPIDHFIVRGEHLSLFANPFVDTRYDCSDHFPIVLHAKTSFLLARPVDLAVAALDLGVIPARLNQQKLRERGDVIRVHDDWSVIGDLVGFSGLLSPDECSHLVEAFSRTSGFIAVDQGVVKSPAVRKREALDPSVREAIVKRRRIFCDLQHCDSASDTSRLVADYEAASRDVRIVARGTQRENFRKFVCSGVSLLNKDPKGYWRFLASVSRYKGSSKGAEVALVVNPASGLASTSETEALVAWSQHYKRLMGSDLDVMDREQWANVLDLEFRLELPGLSDIVSWEEVCCAILRTAPFKAPGCTGIEAGWLRLAIDDPNEDGVFPPAPSTEMGRVFFAIVSSIWINGEIPPSLRSALVVNLFKTGDRSDPDNYRGISLIDLILKTLASVLSVRIQSAVLNVPEGEGLSWMQAGFRRREECMGNVAALLEVCQRRLIDGERTYLAFIDLKKAFDMVPFTALLYKLEAFGIRGTALRFIKALYTDPSLRVRGSSGCHGEEVFLARGVRQGCPLSPILFDIFINDFFDGVSGLCVPALGKLLQGLLFADDSVLCAASRKELQLVLEAIERWTIKNHMEIGVKKCGVMVISPSGSTHRKLVARGSETPFRVAGAPLPTVDSYRYLGFPFNFRLSMETSVEALFEGATKLAGSLQGFCRNNAYPLRAKLDLVRGVLQAKLCYGAEVIGMEREEILHPLSKLFLTTVKTFCRGWGMRPAGALICRELGLPSLQLSFVTARTRALVKYPSLRTVIAELLKNPFVARKWTWHSRSVRWLSRYAPSVLACIEEGRSFTCIKNVLAKVVGAREWAALIKRSKAAAAYDRDGFSRSQGFLSHFVKSNRFDLDAGVRGLVTLRCGAYLSSFRAAAAGLVPTIYRRVCLYCDVDCRETPAHLLVVCARWSEARREFLGDLIDCLRSTHPHLSTLDIGTLLLGGTAMGVEIGKGFACRSRSHRVPVYILVASFLSAIEKQRSRVLWSISREWLA